MRVAHGVNDAARLVVLGFDLPDLLDPRLVGLRVLPVHVEPVQQLLRTRSARALAEDDALGVDLRARLEDALLLPVLVDAPVLDLDADHAILFEERASGGEARIDLDLQLLGLRRQPLHEIGERYGVVPVVGEWRRRDGELVGPPRLRQDPDRVVGATIVIGEALLFEVGNELGQGDRIHHRS